MSQEGFRSSSNWWKGPLIVYVIMLLCVALNDFTGIVANGFFSYLTLQALVFIVPVLVVFFFVKDVEQQPFWSTMGFARISWVKVLVFTLVLFFLSYLVDTAVFSAGIFLSPRLPIGTRYDPGSLEAAFEGLPKTTYYYMIFTSIVYAGFGEELVFRGYVLTRLLREGQLFAIITSSVMWSSLHLWYLPVLGSTGIWEHLDVLLTGLLFGVIYVKTRNILPTILVHASTDILLPLSFLYSSDTVDLVNSIVLTASVLATIGFGTYWAYGRLKGSHSELAVPEIH